MLVKMVQLSPLTDERMRRNEEKLEEKIRPLTLLLKLPRNGVRAAPKWSKGRPEMELGPPQNGVKGLNIPLCFSSFLHFSPHPVVFERG